MYSLSLVIGLIFIIGIIVSNKIESPLERRGIWTILDKMSVMVLEMYYRLRRFLAKKSNNKVVSINSNSAIGGYLERLQPGAEIDKLRRNYIIQKISLFILIIAVGTLVGVAVKYTTDGNAQIINADGSINREEYNGNKKNMSLRAVIDGYESVINFRLNPRQLTEEEIEALMPEFHEKLGIALKGNNPSLDHINTKMNPVVRLSGYPFSIRWSTSDYGLVSPSDGSVGEVEEPCQVFMTAKIKYGGKAWDEEFVVTLVPKEYSEDESLSIGIEKEIIHDEEFSRESAVLVLPQEYEGKSITWVNDNSDYSLLVWLAAVCVAVAVYFLSDKDLEKKVEEKKELMKHEYSEIVRKIALYVGAGMTVRASFQKIAGDAMGKEDANPVYMEMLFTCRELKSGISEEEAYERFGRRTGVQKYIQMSTLLQQNIKRGSANLLGRLREEADNAAVERLQACRKRGEEATTKLLVPMVLMLLVVMVVIMLPAFSSTKL